MNDIEEICKQMLEKAKIVSVETDYDEAKKTAAHRKLPFGTKIKVTNIKNGRSVIVKVNDRGPFVKGRIVDLSKAAFSAIANLSAGVVDVSIEVIK